MKNAIAGSGSFEAGEHTYEVIGMGWIIPWSFASARSSQSQIDILGEEAGEEMQYMLIPYKCYKEEFQPEQILAQFNYASYEDLKKYAEKIQDMFPSTQVYLPDNHSSIQIRPKSNYRNRLSSLILDKTRFLFNKKT